MENIDFNTWRPDFLTIVLTVLIVPLIVFTLLLVRRHARSGLQYVIEGIIYTVGRTLKHSMAASLSLKRYSQLMLGQGHFKTLPIPSQRDISLEVDKIYVPLQLEHFSADRGSYTHENLLEVDTRLRIIGDPGSGKSSLIKRLLRDTCKQALRTPRKTRLAILYELKNIKDTQKTLDGQESDTDRVKKLGEWFFALLRDETTENEVYQMGECFDSYVKTTGILVLLDGLDEVNTTVYPLARDAILGLSKKLHQLSSQNAVILTMRVQFHQQVRDHFGEEYPNILAVRPFRPSDIHDFLMRWPFKSDRVRQVTRIYTDLSERPTLREMCTNPLVLSMYVAETQDTTSGHDVAPDSRTDFYSKVTEELLIKRRQRQTDSREAGRVLKDKRERILGRLAYEHLLDATQPANMLNFDHAIQVIREESKCDESKAKEEFNDIAVNTGLIAEVQNEETFRFIHLTFCEFLAATEAAQGQKDGWSDLIDAHKTFNAPQSRSRLVEVLPFACALLPRHRRASAVSDLMRLENWQLTARAFLETKQYDHPQWVDFLNSEQEALLGVPTTERNEEWLQRLQLLSVLIKDAAYASRHLALSQTPSLEALFQHFLDKRHFDLEEVFSAFARQDAVAAYELARISGIDLVERYPVIVIDNCDQHPFFTLMQTRATETKDHEQLVRLSELMALSCLRSSLVAQWAHETEPPSEWEEYIKQIPANGRWFSKTFNLKKSFYTCCLTISYHATTQMDDFVPLVKFVTMKPPSSYPRFLRPLLRVKVDLYRLPKKGKYKLQQLLSVYGLLIAVLPVVAFIVQFMQSTGLQNQLGFSDVATGVLVFVLVSFIAGLLLGYCRRLQLVDAQYQEVLFSGKRLD